MLITIEYEGHSSTDFEWWPPSGREDGLEIGPEDEKEKDMKDDEIYNSLRSVVDVL